MVSERLFKVSAMSSGSRIDTDVEIVITLYYNAFQVFQCLYIPHHTSPFVVRTGEDAGGDEKEGDGETDG